MKKRVLLLVICATLLLTGGLLLTASREEQSIPSFWWGTNENISISLWTWQDGHDACLQWTDLPLDPTAMGCNLGLSGKWQLHDNQLTLKLEDGTAVTGVLEGDTIQLDYAGGILLESYETLMERYETE